MGSSVALTSYLRGEKTVRDCSDQLRTLLTDEELKQLSKEETRHIVAVNRSPTEEIEAQDLCVEAKKAEWQYRIPAGIIRGAPVLITAWRDVSLLTTLVDPTKVSVAVLGATYLTVGAVTYAMEYAIDEYDKNIEKKCAIRLAQYRHDNLQDFNALSSKDLEKKMNALFPSEDNYFSFPEFAQTDKRIQSIAANGIAQFLRKTETRQQLEDAALQGEALSNDLLTIERNIKHNSDMILKIGEETQKRMNAMVSSVEEVQRGLEIANEHIARNSADIETNRANIQALKNWAYGRMTPQEKINAIDQGFFADMSKEEQKEMKNAAIAEKKLVEEQDTVERIAAYLNAADQLLLIAKQCEIEVNPKLEQAIKVGAAGANLAVAIYSENPMLIVAAVGNLVGALGLEKKSKDIATLRHEQVMEGFRYLEEKMGAGFERVRQGQQVIFDSIQKLAEGQLIILARQESVLNKISDIQRQMDEHHFEMMNALRALNQQILINRDLINKSFITSISLLYQAVYGRGESLPGLLAFNGYNPKSRKFDNYSKFVDYYNQYIDFLSGLKELFDYLNVIEVSGNTVYYDFSLLDISSNVSQWPGVPDSERGNVIQFVNQYNTTLDLLNGHLQNRLPLITPDGIETPRHRLEFAFACLSMQGGGAANLEDKVRLLAAVKPAGPGNLVNKDRLLPHLYSILYKPDESEDGAINLSVNKVLDYLYINETVLEISKILLHVHPFMEYIKMLGEREIYTLEELMAQEEHKTSAFASLNGMLTRLDIAIAQQQLLYGDYFLLVLHEIFRDLENGQRQKALELLGNNSILAHNFIMYGIRSEVIASGDRDFLHYQVAYYSTNDFMIRRITKSPWDFVHRNGFWHIKFGACYHRLPTPVALKQGLFEQTDSFEKLLHMRALIVKEILGYGKMAKKLTTPMEKGLFNKALILGRTMTDYFDRFFPVNAQPATS